MINIDFHWTRFMFGFGIDNFKSGVYVHLYFMFWHFCIHKKTDKKLCTATK